jgi:hypothetical protein
MPYSPNQGFYAARDTSLSMIMPQVWNNKLIITEKTMHEDLSSLTVRQDREKKSNVRDDGRQSRVSELTCLFWEWMSDWRTPKLYL